VKAGDAVNALKHAASRKNELQKRKRSNSIIARQRRTNNCFRYI